MEALQNLLKRKILLKALKLKKMNYLSSDIGDLEILEECILKQKMVVNMIENIILFGESNLRGEFISDAKYVQMLSVKAQM